MTMPFMTAMWGQLGTMRPSSVAFTGTAGSHSSDSNAYDTDPNTAATLASANGTGVTSSYVATYTIGSAPAGVLSVSISTHTEDNFSLNDLNEAISSVQVDYALDGTNYILLGSGSGMSELIYTTPITDTIGTSSNLKVRITCSHVRIGSLDGQAIADSSAEIYDIKLN